MRGIEQHGVLIGLMLLLGLAAAWRSYTDPELKAGVVYVKQVEGAWVPADEIDRLAGIAQISPSRSVGLWIAAFFTLFIFSFLYQDNPLYKTAEASVVGVSAAYYMVVGFWTTMIPNLLGKLFPGLIQSWAMPGLSPEPEPGSGLYVIPLLLGIMLLMRLVPKASWISVWPLAFIIGTTAGLRMVVYLEADFLSQIENTIIPLLVWDTTSATPRWDLWKSFENILLVVSVLACLVYFFFSIEHKGAVGQVSRFGIWILMITFGAMFGMTVMGRIALLAIRLEFLFRDWLNLA